MTRKFILAMATAAAFTGPLAAQSRSVTRIPPGQMPPAGMCRIWINGVPAGRQPAPTDCRTAEVNRPANAHVIYGAASGGAVSRNGLKVTRERDALGRVIIRDANGRVVTRERTNDGWIIWRDANGNVIRRDRVNDRRGNRGDDDDDRDHDRMSKSEREQEKAARRAERARERDGRRMERGDHRNNRRGDNNDDDDNNEDRDDRRENNRDRKRDP